MTDRQFAIALGFTFLVLLLMGVWLLLGWLLREIRSSSPVTTKRPPTRR